MKKYAGIYSLIILLIVSFAWGQTVTNPYPIPFSYLDTDTALTANSDTKVPSQKAIKTYVGSASTTGSANSLKSPATTGLLTATGMGAGTTRAKTVRDADDTILELGGSYTPSATWNWTSATVTWPTFNQSTTGTAAHGTTWGPYAGISGPTQARTFTLPDAAATLLYDGKASGAFGTASSATGSVLLYNSGNANAFTLQPGATGAALSWTLPTAAPGGNNYLLNAQTTGALGYTDPATFSPVAGSASIATVGTVTLGTWNSTRVASAYGGTPGITVGESGYTTFAGAVATLNSAGTNTRLTLPTTLNESISSNLTCNSNIGINQLKGANLTINTGITLTINGPYDGDLSQKFTCQVAGSESLTNGALTTASDKWTAANECTFAGNNATWSYVAGGASTLTQAQADLTIAGVGSHWYAFTYTVSGSTATPTASITTAFAATSTALDLTNGIHITYFLSAAVPANFVITSTLTAGQAFTLDNLSLVQDAGRMVFGTGSIKEAYCEWWGGKANDISIDNSIPINAALFSSPGVKLLGPVGTISSGAGSLGYGGARYYVSHTVEIPSFKFLRGLYNEATTIIANDSGITIVRGIAGATGVSWSNPRNIEISDLTIHGNTTLGAVALELIGTTGYESSFHTVKNVILRDTTSMGLQMEYCSGSKFENVQIYNAGERGISSKGGAGNIYRDLTVAGSTIEDIYIEGEDRHLFDNLYLYSDVGLASNLRLLHILNSSRIRFTASTIENVVTSGTETMLIEYDSAKLRSGVDPSEIQFNSCTWDGFVATNHVRIDSNDSGTYNPGKIRFTACDFTHAGGITYDLNIIHASSIFLQGAIGQVGYNGAFADLNINNPNNAIIYGWFESQYVNSMWTDRNVGFGGYKNPTKAAFVNGVLGFTDGGSAPTYPAGICTEAGSSLYNIGINEGSGNRFGTYVQAKQGGMLTIDARDGERLYKFAYRPPGSSINGYESLALSIGSDTGDVKIDSGILNGNGLNLPHAVNKTASANIHNSHDAVATSTALTYAKAKTIKITNGLVGQQRFLFDIKTVLLGGATAYGKIYRNGIAIGTEQTDATGNYVTKSEDITQTWNPGDTCELWIYTSDGAQAVSVQNFRIAYDDSPTVAVASTNTTP